MSRLLVKCALIAAAIAGGAAMAGLEMHAIIILIVVGLCILVLVIGGPPNDPIDRTLAPWVGRQLGRFRPSTAADH
jgi:hypothetical protein